MAAGGKSDVAFEPGLVDLDVPGRGGNDLAMVDEEGLGGVGADRDLARDRDDGAVEHPAGDFDAVRDFRIETLAVAKIEQPCFETALLLRKRASARRELQVVKAELVDRG